MNNKVRITYEEWQRAVRLYDEQLRDARRRGLSAVQIRDLTQGYLLAVDVAFARYKQAEAEEPGEKATDLLEAALRALKQPLSEGSGLVH